VRALHLLGAAFPFHPLSNAEAMRLKLAPVVMKDGGNAIPWLPMAWVLLVWWNSRGLSR